MKDVAEVASQFRPEERFYNGPVSRSDFCIDSYAVHRAVVGSNCCFAIVDRYIEMRQDFGNVVARSLIHDDLRETVAGLVSSAIEQAYKHGRAEATREFHNSITIDDEE
jgi:hypothetical protein